MPDGTRTHTFTFVNTKLATLRVYQFRHKPVEMPRFGLSISGFTLVALTLYAHIHLICY